MKFVFSTFFHPEIYVLPRWEPPQTCHSSEKIVWYCTDNFLLHISDSGWLPERKASTIDNQKRSWTLSLLREKRDYESCVFVTGHFKIFSRFTRGLPGSPPWTTGWNLCFSWQWSNDVIFSQHAIVHYRTKGKGRWFDADTCTGTWHRNSSANRYFYLALLLLLSLLPAVWQMLQKRWVIVNIIYLFKHITNICMKKARCMAQRRSRFSRTALRLTAKFLRETDKFSQIAAVFCVKFLRISPSL